MARDRVLKDSVTKNNKNRVESTRIQESKGNSAYCLISKLTNPPLDTPKGLKVNKEYYEQVCNVVMDKFYPKHCKECDILLTKKVKGRKDVIRCEKCFLQCSRYSYTPLHGFRMPYWVFGYALEECVLQYPKVVTAKELQRRLGIAYNSALLLKRRIQLLSADMIPRIKDLLTKKLKDEFTDFSLPIESVNIASLTADKAIVNADSVVLFSASQRANKGRKRFKHTGLTASVYLSEKLGGKQIGTLVHTIALKGGGVIYQAVNDQTADTLGNQIREFIPLNSVIFTDEGYPFLKGIYPNHRMVNHSAKSKDKRYHWARNRWSKDGVNNQVAEGNQSLLKSAFRSYHYFRPENASFYLDEYSFLSNVKAYGLESFASSIQGDSFFQGSSGESKTAISPLTESSTKELCHKSTKTSNSKKAIVSKVIKQYPHRSKPVGVKHKGWLKERIAKRKFKTLTLEDRKLKKDSEVLNSKNEELTKKLLNSKYNLLKIECDKNDEYQKNRKLLSRSRRAKEKQYAFTANVLWNSIKENKPWFWINEKIDELKLPRILSLNILKKWIDLGLIEAVDYSPEYNNRVTFKIRIKLKIQKLPNLIYSLTHEEYRQKSNMWNKKAIKLKKYRYKKKKKYA